MPVLVAVERVGVGQAAGKERLVDLDVTVEELSLIHIYKLSEREGEVLRFLAKGRNAQFISEQLNISAYTVKTHVYHIYQKMGVNSQQELITIVDATEVEYH